MNDEKCFAVLAMCKKNLVKQLKIISCSQECKCVTLLTMKGAPLGEVV